MSKTFTDLDRLEIVAKAADKSTRDYFHDLKVLDIEELDHFAEEFDPQTVLKLIADLRKCVEALEEISKLERTAAEVARECLSSLSTPHRSDEP